MFKKDDIVKLAAKIGSGCISFTGKTHNAESLSTFDRELKDAGLTGVFCKEDSTFRIFKTGTLLSRNDEYPSGLLWRTLAR
jgi:hypothetical protein